MNCILYIHTYIDSIAYMQYAYRELFLCINLALYITCAKCKLKIVTVLAVHTEVYIFLIRVLHVTVCILHTKYRTVYNIYRVHCILLKCILNTKNRAVYNTYRVHCIVLQCIFHTKYRTVYNTYRVHCIVLQCIFHTKYHTVYNI